MADETKPDFASILKDSIAARMVAEYTAAERKQSGGLPQDAEDGQEELVTVIWHVQNGLVGCKVSGELQVEADLTDDQIDESVRDHIDQHVIEWGWKKKT